MPARSKSASAKHSSANLGFEATGTRDSAFSKREAIQRPKQSNATIRRLAVMNLAIRGIEADFGPEHAYTFHRDLLPEIRADWILADPPFSASAWFREDIAC